VILSAGSENISTGIACFSSTMVPAMHAIARLGRAALADQKVMNSGFLMIYLTEIHVAAHKTKD
jgi:hypothetical protein